MCQSRVVRKVEKDDMASNSQLARKERVKRNGSLQTSRWQCLLTLGIAQVSTLERDDQGAALSAI